MLLGKIIICLTIIIGIALLFFTLKKVYLNSVRVFNKYVSDNNQELSEEEDLKLYKEKKKKEILKRQLLSQSYSSSLTADYGLAANDTKIISILEPIGKWTKLVMNGHLMKLASMKYADKRNGFWQILVSIQGMMQGKHRSRGR